MSANDSEERDPQDWVLEAWAAPPSSSAAAAAGEAAGRLPAGAAGAAAEGDGEAGGGGWVVLDQRSGVRFTGRHELRCFWVANPSVNPRADGAAAAAGGVRSRRFRLRVTRTRDPAAANSVQVCGGALGF